MGKLDNQIAVVTGGATGIGRATASLFAEEGATVLAADIKEEALKDLIESIQAAGGNAEAFEIDVSDENSVQRFADQVKEKYGRVDVLFNNAGIDQEGGKVHEYPIELFDSIQKTDLRGTFLMSKFLLPLMLENKKAQSSTMPR